MKIGGVLKMDFLEFYFSNIDFSITIQNSDAKRKEYFHHNLTKGSRYHIFNLGPGYIFMT